jgi:hypothetical protein
MNKYILFFLALTGMCIGNSCAKKDNPYKENPAYAGDIQVNFDNYIDADGHFGYTKQDLPIKDSVITLDIKLKLSNTTDVAPKDIAVYLRKEDALVSDYDPALTPISQLSPAFTFDFTKPVIIKKGERKVSVPLKINPAKLNVNLYNAIGIVIEKVEGAGLSDNTFQNKLVIEIGTRNKYDGRYKVVSRVVDPNRTASISSAFFGTNPELLVDLITASATANDMAWPNFAAPNLLHIAPALPSGWTSYGNMTPRYIFDPATNRITGLENSSPVLAPQNRTLTLDAAYNTTSNRMFSDRTIVVRYFMNQSGFTPVAIFDSLTYVGPR